MNIKKQTILFATLFIFVWQKNFAQNFNYQLTKDSVVYSELTSPTALLTNESFIDKHPVLHLPYSFNFCGSVTDSIIVETNGFLVFDKIKELALVSFNNFSGNKDSLGNFLSAITFNTSGSPGNRITKIEFKNLSLNTFSYSDNLTYQVWLYENGNVVEYHIGANFYSTQLEIQMPALVGVINKNMDTENKAFLVAGNASSPSGQIISGENELQYLDNVPSNGIIYRLSPSF